MIAIFGETAYIANLPKICRIDRLHVTPMSSVLPYHVCAAMMCYLAFLSCAVCCMGICLGKKWAVGIPMVLCDVGLCYALVTIGSGAWWGYHAWGSAWVWEPRLTGMLLMTLIFLSWRMACSILGASLAANRKLTATLLVLGLPSMFFTHIAVRFFGGIHPASVSASGSGAISVDCFLLAGILEMLLGLGIGLMDWRMQKKAGRMVRQEP